MSSDFSEKQEFLHSIKYQPCGECQSILSCKWACGADTYPKGLRDFGHPRWEEIAMLYLTHFKGENLLLSMDIRVAERELARRGIL